MRSLARTLALGVLPVLTVGTLSAQIAPGGPTGSGLVVTKTHVGADVGLELALAGGAPGENAFLLLAESPVPLEDELRPHASVLSSEVSVAWLGTFLANGVAEKRLRLPDGPATARLFVRGLALSASGSVRTSPGSAWIGSLPGAGLVGQIGAPVGVTKQLLFNFAIDDPACSETLFGNQRVGMLIPDSFNACDPDCSWYALKPGAAYYEFGDGRALVLAEVFQRDNPDHGFRAEIVLSGRLDPGDPGYPCVGTPYYKYGPLVQCPQYLNTIDPGLWHCYENTIGLLKGTGQYEGAVGLLTEYSAAFQVGVAANDKNLAMSVGGWWGVTYMSQPDSGPALPTASNILVELFGDLDSLTDSQ